MSNYISCLYYVNVRKSILININFHEIVILLVFIKKDKLDMGNGLKETKIKRNIEKLLGTCIFLQKLWFGKNIENLNNVPGHDITSNAERFSKWR